MLKSRTFTANTIEEVDRQKEAILAQYGHPDFSETMVINGLGQYVVSLTMKVEPPIPSRDPIPGGKQSKIHRRG